MKIKDPKTIIRNLYEKYIEVDENIVYVNKLFVVNTIIN